jgi:hypothetical protein
MSLSVQLFSTQGVVEGVKLEKYLAFGSYPVAVVGMGDVGVGIQLLDVDDVVKSIWLLVYIQLLLNDVGNCCPAAARQRKRIGPR